MSIKRLSNQTIGYYLILVGYKYIWMGVAQGVQVANIAISTTGYVVGKVQESKVEEHTSLTDDYNAQVEEYQKFLALLWNK